MKHDESKLIGKLGKKVTFYDTDKRYADFLIRLKQDGIGPSYFLRAVLTGYIHQDRTMNEFVEKIQTNRNLGKPEITNAREAISAGRQALENLKLSDEEIQSIFDILESENPDL